MTLQQAQGIAIVSLRLATRNYIGGRYPEAIGSLLMMTIHALISGTHPLRLNYISPLYAWVVSIISYAVGIANQILAAQDVASVNAITWDFTQFDSTDPAITVAAANAQAN